MLTECYRDQELRFTVHESPDYYKLKISVFSEDKRTDLVGEAWVDLTKIVLPGGGKDDMWQGLNYKGKYAGELRIELTYYDTRPKAEPSAESVVGVENLPQSVGSNSGRVKRRPLPTNPNSVRSPADAITGPAAPGRAKHGPRDLGAPLRSNSMPPESMMQSHHQLLPESSPAYDPPATIPMHHTPPQQYYGSHNGYEETSHGHQHLEEQYSSADFLPQIPPSSRQRDRQVPRYPSALPPMQQPSRPAPFLSMALPHSHSAPSVPHSAMAHESYEDDVQLRTDYPDPIPDLDYQHQQLSHKFEESDNPSGGMYDQYADDMDDPHDMQAPPPPPIHSISAPVVPQYSSPHAPSISASPQNGYQTPPHVRHHSVPNTSPLQSLDRGYGASPRMPAPGYTTRASSVDGYNSSPDQSQYNSPTGQRSGNAHSHYSRSSPSRPLPHRNSIAEPFQTTPQRPHPLSQEVPRPRSPLPPYRQPSPRPFSSSASDSPNPYDSRSRETAPLIKPRAISPQPAIPNSDPRPRSLYSIQHPIRAFESSDNSPLSSSRAPPPALMTSQRPSTARKSVSNANNPGSGTIPFSPDSFNVHNPLATTSTSNLPQGTSPHNPYQVQSGATASPQERPTGPIVGWHGQEIDPSDHLPVDSWAPEPEKKTLVKAYGLGRDRDFGPRSAQSTPPGSGSRNVTKDTVVNFRMKSHPNSPAEQDTPSRNRLQKKNNYKGPTVEPLRERHNFNSVSVPNPYEQQEYSRGFYSNHERSYDRPSGYDVAPGSSPDDALAREISSIDLGSGRNSRAGSVPAPVAYVPVRSHKDRTTFY